MTAVANLFRLPSEKPSFITLNAKVSSDSCTTRTCLKLGMWMMALSRRWTTAD